MIYTAIDAAYNLKPDAQWTCTSSNYSDFTWKDASTAPTEAEINAEIARLQAEYDAKAYARARADAYPTNADFMEAYTEKEIGSDSTKWDAYVIAYNKVRTDNPK